MYDSLNSGRRLLDSSKSRVLWFRHLARKEMSDSIDVIRREVFPPLACRSPTTHRLRYILRFWLCARKRATSDAWTVMQ